MTTRAAGAATRQDFYGAAVRILGERGSAGLTVSELCRWVGVTSGSLYHHFGGLPDFTVQFLEFWLEAQERRPPRVQPSDTRATDPFQRLMATALELPHAAEAAFRGWSFSDERVRAVQTKVDLRRHEHLAHTFRLAGLEAARADEVATSGLAILVGVQMLHRPPSHADLRAGMLPWLRDTLGADCEPVRWILEW